MTTTKFRRLTDQVATSLGQPDARIVEVQHPLGGTDEATVLTWADGVVDDALGLLTTSPSAG